MPHDGVNFWYFKLRLFDVTEFIVWKIGKSEFVAKTQFILNATIILWCNKPFFVFFTLKQLKIGSILTFLVFFFKSYSNAQKETN